MNHPLLLALFALLLTLSACGVDGPPTRPEPEPGLHVSGEARAGVVSSL